MRSTLPDSDVARRTSGVKTRCRRAAGDLPPKRLFWSRSYFKQLLSGAAIGGLAAILAFAAESLLVLRDGSAGLRIELQNTLESLLAAARPLLPSLLLRVVAAYAIAGCALGLAAALLASMLRVRRRWALAIAVELALIFGLLVWDRAIARPALFDDLLSGSSLFAWLVDHGQPWHPRAAACVLLSIHAVVAWRRWRAKLLLPLGIAAQAAATLAFVATGPRSAPHVQRPLIVLIGIDAFRPDRLTVRGHSGEVAPNLEAFTRDAVVFDRAYTPIAQTEPAWRSLLTARWPHRTGVRYPLTPESRYEPAPTFAA